MRQYYPGQNNYGALLALRRVRRAIHVGGLEYHGSDAVEKHLVGLRNPGSLIGRRCITE